MIDGHLLQTDRKYSNLKMDQKEKINRRINEEIRRYYKETGIFSRKENEFEKEIDALDHADYMIERNLVNGNGSEPIKVA